MKRSLMSHTCSGLGLAIMFALGLAVLAIPIIFIRFIVAVAVDGITWK